jgi:anionic cell wall polymer biosynthesis LytR-Cps2A-Psr (LCP) family protein
MKTQREFVMAVISQCLEKRTIDEIKEMIGLAFENIKTNIELQKVLSYLVYAYNFNTENLELLQLPGESIYANNIWLFNYDKDETDKMIKTLKSSAFL